MRQPVVRRAHRADQHSDGALPRRLHDTLAADADHGAVSRAVIRPLHPGRVENDLPRHRFLGKSLDRGQRSDLEDGTLEAPRRGRRTSTQSGEDDRLRVWGEDLARFHASFPVRNLDRFGAHVGESQPAHLLAAPAHGRGFARAARRSRPDFRGEGLHQIESAGADALELNVFVVNTDKNGSAEAYEQIYFDIIESVVKNISIPVAIKLGPFCSNLVSLVNRLSLSGAKGVVMFNRFYEPDVDIEALKVTSASVFSSAADIKNTLRWVAIVSAKIPGIHISASTGIHNAEGAIKQLLVGATTVQVCSAVYKSGPTIIRKMLEDIDFWMAGKGFSKIDDFRAALNYSSVPDPQLYERAQFMKYFSSLE